MERRKASEFPQELLNLLDGFVHGRLNRRGFLDGAQKFRGLNPYIEDVARRLAVANFIAFAPDALTPLGGYPGANHGVFNDTTPRYDAAAAKEAWQRTLGWFDKYLRT